MSPGSLMQQASCLITSVRYFRPDNLYFLKVDTQSSDTPEVQAARGEANNTLGPCTLSKTSFDDTDNKKRTSSGASEPSKQTSTLIVWPSATYRPPPDHRGRAAHKTLREKESCHTNDSAVETQPSCSAHTWQGTMESTRCTITPITAPGRNFSQASRTPVAMPALNSNRLSRHTGFCDTPAGMSTRWHP